MKTISDIAKIAGVAKSTVSRYLNGGSVSGATKKKLEKVINETGYIPNPFAQSLKAKKTNMIGTIVPRLDSYATSHTLIGIDEQLKAQNYQMIIANTSQSIEREIESIYHFANQKVDAIILLATVITEAHIKAFEVARTPVIMIGQEHEKFHCVIHDDYGAGFEIGNYLLAKGHRKIAYLGVTENDIAVGVKRKQGFFNAMKSRQHCEVKYFETGFSIHSAIMEATSILDEYDPTIFVCATDNIALGVCKVVYQKGYKIPADISVTGFGGYEITEVIHPSLTTVQFYYKEAGEKAAKMIIELLQDKEVPKLSISKFKIIERESVDSL
ncbi:LacI family DNA-binding transcriptional regulator [Bacillus sp. FSL K6-3431]|uniref:LacI family DNA-binding transcriptional regulator n=1 Tax=Bacillus sp. FSL K6-3431 TaxID=2921500 RepID=UPI004046A33B